jgi:ATP-binding cassette, subfamily G (WHITE), member 2, PDR
VTGGRAGGRDAGVVSGGVLFNDEPRSQAFFRESAYVKQEDIHIPTLTVRETLRFAARLRLTAPQV